ncbi:MAG: substrate-binding domain-containing protein [Tepidisphaeraceae bacterium]
MLLLLCLVTSGAGCDRGDSAVNPSGASATATDESRDAGASPERGTIGVSVLTLANPFFKEMSDAMSAEAAKHGYVVRVVSAEMDPARQRDQVKDFLVSKVSAVILTPADSRAVGSAIKEANAVGVPVFTADIASIADGAQVVSHVATDNYGGGVQAAQAIVEAVKGKGKVAILDHPEVESVIQRTKGFETEIVKTPDVRVVAKLPGGGARERSYKATQDILQAHADVNAIFAINDPSALGAVAAIEAAGKSGQVFVVGFDGQIEAKKAIRDGKIYADAVQFPKKIGIMTVEQVIKHLSGESVEPSLLIPTSLYRKGDAEKDPEVR